MNKVDINFTDMKKSIDKAGGLFYQYRPCRRDVATIYDIENIRHGVVYAQTPLNMNDPFDSMIGYSPEKIYDNCISIVLEMVPIKNENVKLIVEQLLKYKLLGKLAEFLSVLNDLKKYICSKQVAMHKTNIPLLIFINQNLNVLYSKCPKHIKEILSRESFLAFALIVGPLKNESIVEENLDDIFKMDKILDELHKKAVEIKDTIYIPQIKKILSELTVSCFSASGWNNQLMWSHYANSYSGICVEYDFSKINEFIGFICPVEYTKNRPTVSLKDLGIKGISTENHNEIEYCKPDIQTILSYMLAKNSCWEYEQEWRIINIGEANTPLFIEMPYIKSITLGLNIDPICKHLLWDVCKERGIECYEIKIGTEDFNLSRKKLEDEDFIYDFNAETEYINILASQMENVSARIDKMQPRIKEMAETKNYSIVSPMLVDFIDMLSNAYYFKLSINRICEKSDLDISKLVNLELARWAISKLDEFVCIVKDTNQSINQSIALLYLKGSLGLLEYKKAQKSLRDLCELSDKYNQIEWNSAF